MTRDRFIWSTQKSRRKGEKAFEWYPISASIASNRSLLIPASRRKQNILQTRKTEWDAKLFMVRNNHQIRHHFWSNYIFLDALLSANKRNYYKITDSREILASNAKRWNGWFRFEKEGAKEMKLLPKEGMSVSNWPDSTSVMLMGLPGSEGSTCHSSFSRLDFKIHSNDKEGR